ncbi:hypothetical protein MSG28_014551 [Choristoneura fumiferana]|uniref:Uncharacterized protein n=1 Tax=Choristoneura fumiferana TaxID=7141 RepID=A0ACC0JS30_CHOFU|nr:hypothetical protein MSG28_014551 [Choristoneura fumiferana]
MVARFMYSLARLLTLYQVTLQCVRLPVLRMPKHITDFVASKGIPQKVFERLEDVLADTLVLYMTRAQRERFKSQEESTKRTCFRGGPIDTKSGSDDGILEKLGQPSNY